MSEESIHIEEEFTASENGQGKKWQEEINVTGEELVGKVQELIKEATARKITIKDENGKTLLSLPLWSGIAGVLVFGPWSALALLGAWVANLSILIEYVDLEDVVQEAAEEVAEKKAEAAEKVVDDLTFIKGIGPKTAELLNAVGINSFAEVAALSPEELAEIAETSEKAAKDWIEQAEALS